MDKDQFLECKDCGDEFTFSVGEQAYFAERDFTAPKRCKSCRERRKSASTDLPSPRSKPATRGSR
jgi:hypothetical protein